MPGYDDAISAGYYQSLLPTVLFSDFDFDRARKYINSDLSNNLGNLVSRITSAKLNPRQLVPALNEEALYDTLSEEDLEMMRSYGVLVETVDAHLESFSISFGIEAALELVHFSNKIIQRHQPWLLIKSSDPLDKQRYDCVMRTCCDATRRCAILLQPVVPEMSDRVLSRLGVPKNRRMWSDAASEFYPQDRETGLGKDKGLVFPRLPELGEKYGGEKEKKRVGAVEAA